MTPCKEIFLAIRTALNAVEGIEYIDLYRNQFAKDKESYPPYLTSCLIKIADITWGSMTEQQQEGLVNVEVILYCFDAWAEQQNAAGGEGLIEIDLIDGITNALQFLYGGQFKSIQQTTDKTEDTEVNGLMAYKLSFSTLVYKKVKPKYSSRKMQIV